MRHVAHIFTRLELFELVWSKPIQKIAQELGLSDRGLAKICERHRVPSPPRGYWARVAAGQLVKRPLFREVNDLALDRIEIGSAFSNLPQETQEFLRKAKAERMAKRRQIVDPWPTPLPSPALTPHPIVAATAKALRTAKPGQYGAVSATDAGMCGVAIHAGRVERAITLLDRLAVTLEADGLLLLPMGQRMRVAIGDDEVLFTLIERTRREKHIPSEEEQALYAERQRKRQHAAERKHWDAYMSLPYESPWPEYDTIFMGQLVFTIDGWASGLRKTWADGKTQSIESMFGEIIAGLKVFLAQKKLEREHREEQERQRLELARRHDLAKKRKDREQHRISYLRELVQLQREAADIRSWIAALPDSVVAGSSTELGRMLTWAQDRLIMLETKTTVEAAAAKLHGQALFPDIDALFDPLGEPPEARYF